MTMRSVAVTAVVGLALLGATVQQALSASGSAKTPPVEVHPVSRGVAAEGRVMAYPGADVVVGTERAGRLLSARFEEGQLVKKGDLLAELDSEELRATLAEAKARVSEAEAEIRLADANLKRRQQLVEQQIVAANDLDQARRDIEIAHARRETASAEAERYEAQIRNEWMGDDRTKPVDFCRMVHVALEWGGWSSCNGIAMSISNENRNFSFVCIATISQSSARNAASMLHLSQGHARAR
jgi:multidrug efflux pump subunit AcrA (membrane-fusion protein)